jgi:hypothetical protein
VANRDGGVVKIWARPEDCAGTNTSIGPDDLKPWGSDDCVAWYTPFPETNNQWVVAWTTGVLDEATCQWHDQKLWTAEGRGEGDPSFYCDDDRVYVHRLDGETGVVEDTVAIPFPCTTFGFWGGAVDANNDLWLTRIFEPQPFAGAIRVDFEMLDWEHIPSFKGFGITVDHDGMIWGSSFTPVKWDPATETLTAFVGQVPGSGGSTGLAEDHVGRVWVGIHGGGQAIDAESMALLDTVAFPGETREVADGQTLTMPPVGFSVDVDGFIWAVSGWQDRAFRVDPVTLDVEVVDGLEGAYAYSDMAGGALNAVACNPPAG